jgi:hypothetical protein
MLPPSASSASFCAEESMQERALNELETKRMLAPPALSASFSRGHQEKSDVAFAAAGMLCS